ncbi:MAG TPA: hypothetical protein VKQ72_11025, partial [Aggregatilineales bacterium]|nr:hypothetical protein [Aggregatilineales bacterium]
MMLRRVLLTLGVMAALAANVPAHAQGQDVPYLYYFDYKSSSFVVERADGSDLRILGDGLMSSHVGYAIAGPGWSPSGRWFAWTAAESGPYHNGYFKPYAIRADGQRRVTLLDDFTEGQLAWAPQDDLLLLADQPFLGRNFGALRIELIDPERNVSIAAFNAHLNTGFDLEAENMPALHWTDDEHAIVEFGTDRVGEFGWKTTFFVSDTHGKTLTRPFDRLLSDITSLDEQHPASVSATGNVAYLKGTTLVIENVVSGASRAIGSLPDPGPKQTVSLQWSPDGRYGLLFGTDIRLLSVDSGQLQVILPTFAAADDVRATPLAWSPDSRHGLLAGNNTLYELNLSAPESKLTELRGNFPTTYFPGNPGLPAMQWLDGGRLALADNSAETDAMGHPASSAVVHIDDLETGDHRQFQVNSQLYQFSLSSDERYLAYVDKGPIIYDAQTNTYHHFRPAATAGGAKSGSSGEMTWSPDKQWVLIRTDALIAGGAFLRDLGVMRADGELRSDLSFSADPSANTFNWLPSQVKAAYLAPPLPKPLYGRPQKTLHSTGWVHFLSWSPDSQQLLSKNDYTDSAALWNIAAGTSTTVFDKVGLNNTLAWQSLDNAAYRPIIVPDKPQVAANGSTVLAAFQDGRQAITASGKDWHFQA